jgi:hypothetical protein
MKALTLLAKNITPSQLIPQNVGKELGKLPCPKRMKLSTPWETSSTTLETDTGATYTGLLDVGLRSVAPVWFWLVGVLELLGQVSFAVFFLLFPSGRFVPRWSRWGVPLIVLNEIWYVFFVNQFVGQRLPPSFFASSCFDLPPTSKKGKRQRSLAKKPFLLLRAYASVHLSRWR